MPTVRRFRRLATFTGDFLIMEDADDTLRTGWPGSAFDLSGATEDPHLAPSLAEALDRYFSGEAVTFDDVPLPRGTAFQQRCWAACRAIPWGRRRTYAALARAAGSGPGAARAVGQAMRRNPLPIVVPCHRVLGADDRLTGFAGSDDPTGDPLRIKQRLLDHEGGMDATLPWRMEKIA